MPSRFEPFVQLVDVTATAALVAWGGFVLEPDGDRWRARRTGETFGARSAPAGRAVVEVLDGDGRTVARQAVDDANQTWVEGLEPATTYGYRVSVYGEPWGLVERHDWAPGALRPASRALDLRLRTHAAADEPDPVTFLAVGDTGVGLDDHLAFYPTAGNHDGSDDEDADDRAQLEDNLYLTTRFAPRAEAGRASLEPGLFYRLQVGALLELVCIDTTWGAEAGEHWFEEPKHCRWLDETFASTSDDVVWRVPFCHHPAWSAGPHHASMEAQIEHLVPRYRRGGARVLLHGHEHNFQHGRVDGLDYLISGAGGKLDERPPRRTAEAGTESWAATPHCLLVHVTPEALTVVPYGGTPAGGQPMPLVRRRPDGSPVDEPIVITTG